jgi:hypothetical protein
LEYGELEVDLVFQCSVCWFVLLFEVLVMSFTEIVNGKRDWTDLNSVAGTYKLALEYIDATSDFNEILKGALLECGFREAENRYVYALGEPISEDHGYARVMVVTYMSLKTFGFIKVTSRHGVEEVKDISKLFDLIRSHWE